MNLKETLIIALPPFRNEKVLIKQRQGTGDIIESVLKIHGEYETDYDRIYQYFDTGNIYDTSKKIWDFLKYNLVYDAESGKDQSVKSPSAILHPGEKIDCKHYALFAGGILDAIKANEAEPWDWCYRFASDKSISDVSHVFVVVNSGGKEIWIDPCLTNFDQRKKYLLIEDVQPMSLYKISGVGEVEAAEVCGPAPIVIVDKKIAWESFLGLLTIDFLGMKSLMIKNMSTTVGPVKQYCESNGFDFQQLLNFLNS